MDVDTNQYVATINEMIIACNKRAYKNNESLIELRKAFEKLSTIRRGLMLRHNNFPGDLSVAGIIEEISKTLSGNIPRPRLQWTFDHFTDLFAFKAEDLLNSINKFFPQMSADARNADARR